MITKMASKIGKWPFWSKFGTFDREINIEHKDILTDDENYQGAQHTESFLYLSVLISNS